MCSPFRSLFLSFHPSFPFPFFPTSFPGKDWLVYYHDDWCIYFPGRAEVSVACCRFCSGSAMLKCSKLMSASTLPEPHLWSYYVVRRRCFTGFGWCSAVRTVSKRLPGSSLNIEGLMSVSYSMSQKFSNTVYDHRRWTVAFTHARR